LTDEKVDFIFRAKAAGFFIRVFFVGTDSPEINAARVARRVMEGGHDVPIPKIISRYSRSIQNMMSILPVVDRAYIYDNSAEDHPAALQFRTADGRIAKLYHRNHPWADLLRTALET